MSRRHRRGTHQPVAIAAWATGSARVSLSARDKTLAEVLHDLGVGVERPEGLPIAVLPLAERQAPAL